MHARYLAAAIQMNSGEEKEANLAAATRLVERAAADGARLIVLPELFNCLGRFAEIVAAAEPIPGPTSDALARLAARLEVTIVAGSIAEQAGDEHVGRSGKAYNTSLVFAPSGEIVAKYRKLHLFDVAIDQGPHTTESQWILPGSEISCVATELGMLGQSICFDLRFAELYRALAARGADVLLVPSAFTRATGQSHWHTLLRARAIENQAYVIAPNQCGSNSAGIDTYGHSLIIDPWGKILAEAGDDSEETIVAEIDPARITDVRRQMILKR